MKLYVYCLAQGIDALTESVTGISGAPVRLLKVEDFVVLVSDLDIDTVPVNRDNALSHAAAVRSVLKQTTPLPFRFGTLVAEQPLRNYLAARQPALEAKLAHVRDCFEMNVKIIGEDKKRQPAVNSSNVENQGVGTAFLEEKRRELLGTEQRTAQAEEISNWLHKTVTGLTRDEQMTVHAGQRLFLAAAHLVEHTGINKYRESLARAREHRPELHFLVSGPWPPYSFANIELEFKTQFGVS